MFPSRTRRPRASVLLGFGLVTAATAIAATRTSKPGMRSWYASLKKAPFQPPDAVFGPVWTTLYALIALSGGRVYAQPQSGARTRALQLWAAQLALNGAWSWLFFAARKPGVALADSTALLATTLAYAKTARNVDRTAARLFVPYVAWTAFATVLNGEVVRRNPVRVKETVISVGGP